MKKLNPNYLARLWVDDKSNHPVNVVKGNKPPETVGDAGYYTTPSGNTIVHYPSAYKWPTVYHCSTLEIEVGKGWLYKHRGAKYYRSKDGTLSVVLPKKYHYKIHGFKAIPCWTNMVEQWIVIHNGYEYHAARYGLKRKNAIKACKQAIQAERYRNEAKLMQRKVKSKKVWVGFDDSISSGNCVSATRSFKDSISKMFDGEIGGLRADILLSIRNDSFTNRAVQKASIRY
jgi:hypothetical protein